MSGTTFWSPVARSQGIKELKEIAKCSSALMTSDQTCILIILCLPPVSTWFWSVVDLGLYSDAILFLPFCISSSCVMLTLAWLLTLLWPSELVPFLPGCWWLPFFDYGFDSCDCEFLCSICVTAFCESSNLASTAFKQYSHCHPATYSIRTCHRHPCHSLPYNTLSPTSGGTGKKV